MKCEIVEIGEGLGIILPDDALKHLGVKPGDDVVIRLKGGTALIESHKNATMRAGRKVAARYRKALRDLSK